MPRSFEPHVWLQLRTKDADGYRWVDWLSCPARQFAEHERRLKAARGEENVRRKP